MGSIPIQRETDSRPAHHPSAGTAGTACEPPRPAVSCVRLPGDSLAPGTARRFVRAALAEWAADGHALPAAGRFAERLVEDASLLVSELVTNAVVHAGTDVDLLCRLEDGDPAPGEAEGLVVEVSDHHPARPVNGGPQAAGEYGRGLQLVGALADSWGVSYRRGLKTVWFRLPIVASTEPNVSASLFPGDQAAAPLVGPPGAAPRPPGWREADPDWAGGVGSGALSFLAEASDLLSGQFDEDKVAALAVQLLVPRLADWGAVWFDGEGGRAPAAPRLARVWDANESRTERLRAALEDLPAGPATLPAAVGSRPVPWPWPALPAEEGEDAGAHEVLLPSFGDGGAALACRLVAGGRCVGTLVLGRAGLARFPDDVTMLIEDFARRVALAVLAARQYTRQATTSLVLQRGLRPSAVAAIPGVDTEVVYEPAEGAWAGGDFYDVFQAGDGRWCFALGDVCGNGPEAAVVTGLVRPWLKLLAHEGYSVAGVLDRLNRMLVDDATQVTEAAAAAVAAAGGHASPDAGPVRFLSLLYGELRPVPGADGGLRCTLASAGHPLPLLLRPDGEVGAAAEPQVLLGVLEQTAYESQSFDLAPGDTLLCVTDGVTERRCGARQFDDGDGLATALAGCAGLDARAVADRIRRAAHDFGTTPPDDDLAILVLQAR